MTDKETLGPNTKEFYCALEYLFSYQKEAKPILENSFQQKLQEAENISSLNKEVVERLAEFCQKGKMLRGALITLGYEAFGGEKREAVIPFSAAYEILGSAILIHDDIIDQSELRQGEITIHNYYAQSKDSHYGESMGITIGDLAHTFALEILSDPQNPIPPESRLGAINHVSRIIQQTTHGEILDINWNNFDLLQEEDILKIQKYKTAFYTFSGPLQLGAILAEAHPESLNVLEEYGIPIGLAFQIKDDILGIFGSVEKFGKPVDTDIREGKVTLLAFYAFQNATAAQKEFLKKFYGNREIGKSEVEQIREIFRQTGAFRKAEEKAKKFVEEGKMAIPKITPNTNIRNVLTNLADFVIERER